MTERQWRQIGGAGGIVFVVVVLAAVAWAPLTTATPEPPFDGPAAAWLAYARATGAQTIPRTVISILALFGFPLFAVSLAMGLRTPDGRWTFPSILVLLATGLSMALWMAASGANLAVGFVASELDATKASLLFGLANGLFAASWFAIAGLALAAGVGALESRALPRWLAWSAVVIGCGFVLGGAVPLTGLWYAPYFLWYAWIVAVSVRFLRSSPTIVPS